MLDLHNLSRYWMELGEPERAMMTARIQWMGTARPKQLTPDGDWSTWMLLGGRGAGKTRTGAEDAAWFGMTHPGARLAIVAPTFADCRDTCVEGESGLLNVIPSVCVADWKRSLGEVVLWNTTRFKLFSADEPERLRGPQHHRVWADELAAWRYPDAWDQLQFGLRLGTHPQVVVTTTPKPTSLVRRLIKDPTTIVFTESTFANAANLPASTLAQLQTKYGGTRLGRQELEAELLDDVPGALWPRAVFDKPGFRVPQSPQLQRVVVGVDPSGTSGGDDGDSVGIIVAGKGIDGRAYLLADNTCHLSPAGWGRRTVESYKTHLADSIVAEKNFGGAMVEHVIRTVDPRVPIKMVTASRNKVVRAEPVAALYEQGRVSHVGLPDRYDDLEGQLLSFTPDGYVGEGSPDRADALVWALSDLMLEDEDATGMAVVRGGY